MWATRRENEDRVLALRGPVIYQKRQTRKQKRTTQCQTRRDSGMPVQGTVNSPGAGAGGGQEQRQTVSDL